MCRDIWYQHDGPSDHSTIVERDYLNRAQGNDIGWTHHWSPRSPDLSTMGFLFVLVMRSSVDPRRTVNGPCCTNSGRHSIVHDMSSVFENVGRSRQRRCESCVHSYGRNF
ncbi:hypothetical protein HNY73_006798 [Argiope bruennichi]|uniref:Uncharacterized protein n=1 Tax=Argiope bruennichi TaxID=94029 RepID=A0A8T0FEP5_ARGBR|nr:hypothetical protein HNY73_006798 [Argiope bruennichi]